MNAIAPLASFAGAQEVLDAFLAGAALDPPQLAWEFANEHVNLSSEMAAEIGRYDVFRTPYLIELLTNLSSSSPVIQTILMKGSQIGASQGGLAFVLYVIAVAGGPMLVVCPTKGMAELYSKQRLEPLIRDCEPTAKKLPSNKGKESGNTILLKSFPGGILRLVGAGAVNPLKSMPAKVVVFEEPDEYERDLEGQGDATKIVLRRITTFGRRAKVYMNCTPGLQSRSIIYPAFLKGDQREYRMPCPHGCGHLTVFNKDLFRFERGRPETAHMVCENVECGKPILEGRHKTAMMAYGSGVWVPKVKDAPPDTPRSYYLPAFYSPVGWESWADIARDIEAAEGKYELSKTLWNQTFGLPWQDVTDRPDHEALFRRAKLAPYRMREIPEGVVFLAAGLDVGIDHIEIGVWGYGRRGQRWLIEHVRIRGSKSDPETWAQAETFLMRRYLHPSGAVMQIRRAGVDRGKWPEIVVPWVKRQDPDFIVAIRGNPVIDAQILKEAFWREKTDDGKFTREGGFVYWVLGVGILKLELYTYLGQPSPREDRDVPPGFVHLPNDVTPEWVEQLVSEEYVETTNKRSGRAVMSWRKVGGVRGEALDTCNYARAMAELVGWSNWSEADYLREEAALAAHAEDLRKEMAREQARRLSVGDTRPVIEEDIVSGIVRPEGFERPEPETIALPAAVPAAPAPKRWVPVEQAKKSTIRIPRGMTNDATPDGGIERPAEVGVAGKASASVDVRAMMRGSGLGRSASHDED